MNFRLKILIFQFNLRVLNRSSIKRMGIKSIIFYRRIALRCEQIEMKYFEKLNVQLRQLGILQWDSSLRAKRIAMATRCALLAIYVLNFLAPAWYFLMEAQTSRDHSESAIIALSTLLLVAWYLAILLQNEKYASISDELNSIIEKST